MKKEMFCLQCEELESVTTPVDPFSREGAVVGWGFVGGLVGVLIIGAIT